MPFDFMWSRHSPPSDLMTYTKGEGSPSTYGDGKDKTNVRDPKVRSSTRWEALAWPTDEHFFTKVNSFLRNVGVNPGYRCANEELLCYKEGDHFVTHADAPHSPLSGKSHLGTLLYILPCEEGGRLRVYDGSWGKDGREAGSIEPRLVWMKLGVRHEVTPVIKGERWVLKASIFGSFKEPVVYRPVYHFVGPADNFSTLQHEYSPSSSGSSTPELCDNWTGMDSDDDW